MFCLVGCLLSGSLKKYSIKCGGMILNGMIRTVVIAAAVVLAVFGGTAAFKYYKKSAKAEKGVTDVVLEQNWVKREVGRTGVKILAPDNMRDLSFAAVIADNATSQDVRQFSLGTFGFTVLAVETENEISGEAFSADLVNKIKGSGAASSFEYEIKPERIGGSSGWRLSGTANAGGQKIRVEALSFSAGKLLRHIAVSFDGNDDKLEKLTARIMDSAEIEQMH